MKGKVIIVLPQEIYGATLGQILEVMEYPEYSIHHHTRKGITITKRYPSGLREVTRLHK